MEHFSLNGTFLIIAGIFLHGIPYGLIFISPKRITEPAINVYASDRNDTGVDINSVWKDKEILVSVEDGDFGTCNADKNANGAPRQCQEREDDTNAFLKDSNEIPGRGFGVDDTPYYSKEINPEKSLLQRELDEGNESGLIDRHLTLFRNTKMCLFFISQFLFFSGFLVPFIYIPDKAKNHGK